MPSFLRNARSFSFPPFVDHDEYAPSPETDHQLPDIDEDPFSHFLAPVAEEDDPYDALSLSGGIIVPEGHRSTKSSKFKSTVADKWARYVRSHHVQLHHRYHEHESDHDEDDDEESFVQLDDDRLLDVPQAMSQLSRPPTPRITVSEPTRGRAQELVSSRPRLRSSRTLSGRRRSWREPSPDLFTVDESEEHDVMSVRRTKSRSAATTESEEENKDGDVRRRSQIDMAEKARL